MSGAPAPAGLTGSARGPSRPSTGAAGSRPTCPTSTSPTRTPASTRSTTPCGGSIRPAPAHRRSRRRRHRPGPRAQLDAARRAM